MLEKKTALVTGAGKGSGRAIALALAKMGVLVIVNYRGSKEQAEETVQKIREMGQEAEAYPCDVSDFQAVETMMKTIVSKYGRLDILVNNAGITKDGLILKMSEEDFDKVVDTNLKGTFHTIRHASRQMIRQRSGRIINISSVSGVMGNPGQANYAAAKAGIIGLTKTMAKELGSRGITVNAIAPGFIETDMTAVLSESVQQNIQAQIPLGHFGKPEDVAAAAAFLASEEAGYITGQVLCVDGGMV